MTTDDRQQGWTKKDQQQEPEPSRDATECERDTARLNFLDQASKGELGALIDLTHDWRGDWRSTIDYAMQRTAR